MDAETLRSIVDYDAATGSFKWKHDHKYFSWIKAGDEVGKGARKSGYRCTTINGKQYYQHRLVWLYVYGELPSKPIDHINGVKDDNRVENLRLATPSENQHNRRKTKSKAGLTGAYRASRGNKWYSTIMVENVKTYLGTFNTEEEAGAAYAAAKAKLHTFSPHVPTR